MNPIQLISLGAAMDFLCGNPFRPAKTMALSYLDFQKPAGSGPHPCVIARKAAPRHVRKARTGGDRIESWVLKSMMVLAVVTAAVCVMGLQNIAYTKRIARLSAELKAREQELAHTTRVCLDLRAQGASLRQFPEPVMATVRLAGAQAPPRPRSGGRI